MSKGADARDVEWMRAVMDGHERPLLRYAARLLGDVERARDVVQDTFLQLWKMDPAPAGEHVAMWLFTVCRNRALNVIRKERRMRHLSRQQEVGRPSGQASPEAALEKREVAGQVAVALAQLPGNQQDVIRLKFQDGFSYKEIAGITGLSVSNVGFLLHKGIRTLRDQFRAAGLIGRT